MFIHQTCIDPDWKGYPMTYGVTALKYVSRAVSSAYRPMNNLIGLGGNHGVVACLSSCLMHFKQIQIIINIKIFTVW